MLNEQDQVLIEKYLEGELNEQEIKLFEQKMTEDDFKQEVESQQQMLNDLERDFTLQKNRLNLNLKVVEENDQRGGKIKKNLLLFFLLLLLAVLGWWFFMDKPNGKKTVTYQSNGIQKQYLSPEKSRGIKTPKEKSTENSIDVDPSSNKRPLVSAQSTDKSAKSSSYFLIYIPEYVFYSGKAFMDDVPNKQKKRAIKIYRALPEANLNPTRAYYQFVDTLCVYGKPQVAIEGLIHEKSKSRYHLIVQKDTLPLQINDKRWRLLKK